MTTKVDRDEQCEWMTPCVTNDERNRKGQPVKRLMSCLLTPVVALVDVNLLKGMRSSRRGIHVCAHHAKVYFHALNHQRSNHLYGPFVRRQERAAQRRRESIDRELRTIEERRRRRLGLTT